MRKTRTQSKSEERVELKRNQKKGKGRQRHEENPGVQLHRGGKYLCCGSATQRESPKLPETVKVTNPKSLGNIGFLLLQNILPFGKDIISKVLPL